MEEQEYIDQLIDAGATDDEIVEALSEFRKRQPAVTQVQPEESVGSRIWNTLNEGAAMVNRGLSQTVSAPLKLLGAGEQQIKNLIGEEGEPLFTQAGQAVEDFTNRVNPVTPEFESSIPGQVLQGVGQAGGMILSGGLGAASRTGQLAEGLAVNVPTGALGTGTQIAKEIGKTAVSRPGFIGGSMTAAPEWEAAKEAGLSDEDAFGVMIENYFVGQTEALPIKNILGRLNKATGNSITNTIKNMATGGLEEGVQEGIQTYLTNEIAKGNYDPDRDPFFQVLEAGGVGAIVGMILPGVGTVAQRIADPTIKRKLVKKIITSTANNVISDVADTGDPNLNQQIDDQANEVIETIANTDKAQQSDTNVTQSESTVQEPVIEKTPITQPTIDKQSTDYTQLAQEFNDMGSLMGQAEDQTSKKPALAENVADFLRQKNVNSQEGVDSFVDAWNELPIEGKPILKIADAKRIGELVSTKPSVAPRETITLTLREAVQDLNKAMEKGVKKGQKLINENLVPKVQEALKEAKLSPRQTSAILTKLKNTNLFTPGSYSKLDSFISKVVDDANYAESLAKAKSLQKRVKKFGRQKAENIPINYKVVARQFGKINPTEMSNIDEYIEKANSIVSGFRPVTAPNYSPINVSESEDYIDKVLTTQEEEQEKEIEETSNDSTELRAIAQGAVERLKGKDLSGFSEREKEIIKTLQNIDVNRLVGGEQVQSKEQDQLKRLTRIIDNINTNDDLSGESFIENIAAVRNFIDEFEALQKSENAKISEIGAWGRTMYNISNMVKRIYQNDKIESYFRSFVHGPLLSAGSQTEKAVVDASQGFDKKLKELNKKFNTELREVNNKADMMVFSLMYQMDNEVDISKIHRNIRETIKRNREVGNENEAKAWEQAYDAFKDVTTADQALEIIKQKNPSVYEMWKFFGVDNTSNTGIFTDELASEQARVAKEVYNREYAPTVRYTPIVQHDVNTLYRIAETISEGGEGARQTTIKPSQARTAKRRTLNLAANKVYTLEPYTDWILRYGETTYDNKASKAEARMAELIMTPEFTKLTGGNDNALALGDAYRRMVTIQRGTNRLISSNDAENLFTEIAKTFRSIGTVKALASVSQALKQSTVSVKTLANLISTGDVDLVVPAYHAVVSLKTNPSENNPVKKLIDQSTLIARGLRMGGTDRGTSEAYKLQRGATKWFYKILEDSRTTIDKRTRASLSLLVRPDIFNARLAFVSYYLQGLRRQGVTDVDMNTEFEKQNEPSRQQAMAFAENMVEKTQTASNPAAMSAIQAQTQSKGWEFVKTVFLPFSTFDADFKARLTNEISAVRRSGNAENVIKLGGTISEALAFAALNAFLLYWYKEFLREAVRGVTGAETPEKSQEKIDKEQRQQFLSSVTSALNPIAIGTIPQEAQSNIINEIGYLTANPDNLSKKDWLKSNALVYQPREGSLIDNLGAYSTGIQPLKELIETLPQYRSILDQPVTITDGYGNEKIITLTNEQKSIMLLKGIAESLTLAGLTEADVANAIRAVYREQMKNGEYNSSQNGEKIPDKKRRQFE
jgi:hypothetical protein